MVFEFLEVRKNQYHAQRIRIVSRLLKQERHRRQIHQHLNHLHPAHPPFLDRLLPAMLQALCFDATRSMQKYMSTT